MKAKYPELGDVEWKDIYSALTNLEARLTASHGKKGWSAVLKAVLRGTTFSGHSTATTLFGTLRNIMYALFAYTLTDHGRNCGKQIKFLLKSFRNVARLFCSGDDGGLCSKMKEITTQMSEALLLLGSK